MWVGRIDSKTLESSPIETDDEAVLHSTIFRSACFTLGRRDAAAWMKSSGTGTDQQ